MKARFLLLFLVTFYWVSAQEKYSRKHQGFAYWGYNRATYANSDITFQGKGYDFTLQKVVAVDYPSPFSFDTYFNPSLLSIPQFNFRAGYFIADHWCLSIGWDHMKYVMVNDQTVPMTGYITPPISDPAIPNATNYAGVYNNTPMVLGLDFLKFEHTDGFNYASIELDRYDKLWKATNGIQKLDWLVGFGIGGIVPRSDVRLFGEGLNHYWNLSGWGVSLKTGLRFDISRRIFLQNDVKGGFTHLTKIPTTGRNSDHAEQKIWFLEDYLVLGYTFGTKKKTN